MPALALDEATMCCIDGKVPFRFGVYKDGTWKLGDVMRVLNYYNDNFLDEGKVTLLHVKEGGLQWPGTAASSAQWSADVAYAGDDLFPRQLRLCCSGKSSWPAATSHYWPWGRGRRMEDFEIAEGLLELRAKCSPSLGMVADMIDAFRACRYPLAYTEGVITEGGPEDVRRFKKSVIRKWYLKPTCNEWRRPEEECDCQGLGRVYICDGVWASCWCRGGDGLTTDYHEW
ncbi:hypothetical protein JKP88DRAFT_272973 [Tribonema minus]|uniref:Uncharacterized protein n=1 Tax=Tribonema minus TaxID=303371 RepID=A0A836CEP1_9STRA|nr:hypothetical protein JKP88DRAFT_272973 [Tribonema minus]